MNNRSQPKSDRSFGHYIGKISPQFDDPAIVAQVSEIHMLVDSADAYEVSRGKNRIVRVRVEGLDLAIKRFGSQSSWKDHVDRKRGTGACRSWLAATALQQAAVGTPTPVACCERWDGNRLKESYLVTEFLDDVVSFKDALLHLYYEDPVCEKIMTLLDCVSEGVRNMHEAGFQHNDLGNQNILLSPAGDGYWRDPRFVDLNRGRLCQSLTAKERARDIARIALPSDLLRAFVDKYYGVVPPDEFVRWQKHYRRRYAWHNVTRRWRHPLRESSMARVSAGERKYPSPRDIWVWDDRSAQAIGVLVSPDKKRHYPVSRHFTIAADGLCALAGVWRTYREVLPECFRREVRMADTVGVWLEPTPERAEREMELLAELGKIPVMLRLYHHESAQQHRYRIQIANELHRQGHKVGIAMVQDRHAVLSPSRWAEFVRQNVAELRDVVELVEIGHTLNRVKWGAWSMRDIRGLLAPLGDLIRQYPQITFMGPACIDFEYPFVVAALKQIPENSRFGALSHQLYVDRRGAPENRQGGFSALEKFALARAIARWSTSCEDRFIVSEVNWPIDGTGEYSPVGSPYVSPGERLRDPSVSEDEYADYMLRYLCMAICSGMAERVYWWRLVARGFGLVDDTDHNGWRKRPAFEMLKVFLNATAGSTYTGFRSTPSIDQDPGNTPTGNSRDESSVATTIRRYAFERDDSGHRDMQQGRRFELIYCPKGSAGPEQVLEGVGPSRMVAMNAFGKPLGHETLSVGGRPLYVEWIGDVP